MIFTRIMLACLIGAVSLIAIVAYLCLRGYAAYSDLKDYWETKW